MLLPLQRPADLVLPRVKKVARLAEILLVRLPHVPADVYPVRLASRSPQRVNEPKVKIVFRGHGRRILTCGDEVDNV